MIRKPFCPIFISMLIGPKYAFLLVLMMCLFALKTKAQHPILASFELVQVDNTVQLTFGVLGGASCNGVQWERAGADLDFQTIASISGVCGGSEFTEYYSLVDEAPLTGELSYYRLVLGNQGRSQERTFLFVELDDGVKLYPNPSSALVNLRFSNPSQKLVNIRVFDITGSLVFEDLSQNGEYQLKVSDLARGVHLLEVQTEDQSIAFRRRFQVID